MAVNLSPVGGVAAQFFDNNGVPLAGGKLYTYAAGTTTPVTAYTSSQGVTAWSNPIILNSAGRVSGSGEIWITDGILYKFVLETSTGVLIATYDNISGINSNAVAFVNQQEIVTATAGQTVFNLGISYQPATNSLSVFVDGVNQYGPGAQYAYTETDSDTVTFTSGLHVGAEVKFTTTQQQGAGAVDASQVSYDPPFTGSVATNVEAKLAQYVSVKDFGAVGDGVVDDTAAIVSALSVNAAISFPPGNYLVSGNINIQNKTLIGNSWRDTIIQLAGSNTNTPVFINSANSGSPWGSGNGFTLDNLTVRGNWDGTTANPVNINDFNNLGSIVRWYAGAYANVTNCDIQNSFAHGLGFERLGYSYIQYNHIFTNKYDGVHLSGPSGTESITSTWVSNNSINSCRGTACIYVKNGLTMIATQNILEDATNGFYVDGNDNRGVSFCFNDMEQMSASGVNIQGSGQWFEISNNFLGVTTPITIANSPEFRGGSFTNNAFSTLDYVTVAPTIGSGATSDTPMNFYGLATNGTGTGKIGWRSNNNNNTSPEVEIVGIHWGTVNQRGGRFLIRTADPATNTLVDRVLVDEVGNTHPMADNTQTLGAASLRWSVVYAGTGTINTSDANAKQDIRTLLDAEKAVAIEIKGLLKAYRFKDAVAIKGDGARIHFGAVAQDVAAAFAGHGLDANRYGLFCSDTWYVDAQKKVYPSQEDIEGNKIDNLTPITRLGLRYDELFSFIISAI